MLPALREVFRPVLILVLMEYVPGASLYRPYPSRRPVLILVIMEQDLGEQLTVLQGLCMILLNPCFNGIWSRTDCQP